MRGDGCRVVVWMDAEKGRASSVSVNERKANEWRENGMATRQAEKKGREKGLTANPEGRSKSDPKLPGWALNWGT